MHKTIHILYERKDLDVNKRITLKNILFFKHIKLEKKKLGIKTKYP